ncbi:MAG: hypothetical protein Q9178_004573 [Gyalolechia marmorata]
MPSEYADLNLSMSKLEHLVDGFFEYYPHATECELDNFEKFASELQDRGATLSLRGHHIAHRVNTVIQEMENLGRGSADGMEVLRDFVLTQQRTSYEGIIEVCQAACSKIFEDQRKREQEKHNQSKGNSRAEEEEGEEEEEEEEEKEEKEKYGDELMDIEYATSSLPTIFPLPVKSINTGNRTYKAMNTPFDLHFDDSQPQYHAIDQFCSFGEAMIHISYPINMRDVLWTPFSPFVHVRTRNHDIAVGDFCTVEMWDVDDARVLVEHMRAQGIKVVEKGE